MKEIVVVLDRVVSCYSFRTETNWAPLGRLPKKFATLTFLLIGVPVGSSTTWNKSAEAIPVDKSVKAVIFLSVGSP